MPLHWTRGGTGRGSAGVPSPGGGRDEGRRAGRAGNPAGGSAPAAAGRRRPALTWLSSFSAAIRSLGSMVPFSAWMIRLRSISPGGGSAAPGPIGQTADLVLFGPSHLPPPRRLDYLTPQPPPRSPPAATCCATLTPRPLSSLFPPHNSLSIHPFTTAGGRREK